MARFGFLTGSHTTRAGRPFSELMTDVGLCERDQQKRPQSYHGQRWNGQTMVFCDDDLGFISRLVVVSAMGICWPARRGALKMPEPEF